MNFEAKKTTVNNIAIKKYQRIKPQTTPLVSSNDYDADYISNQVYKAKSAYNHNNNSDLDSIYIHNVGAITNDIRNIFTNEDEYLVYCEYLEGKTLQDIINENYEHNLIGKNDEKKIQEIMNKNNITGDARKFIDEINRKLKIANEKGALENFSKLSEEMLNSEIIEVCHNDSGYDALVLKDTDGNYMIVNSWTNDHSLKDILAISYPMCKYLTGSEDFVQIVFDYLANNADLANVSQEYFSIAEYFDGNKNLYEEQLNDNIELIEKYCDKAKSENVKVDLYGYSLGGGIQETAYAKLKDSNSDKQQYIQSISVYNPFTLYAQEYQDNFIDLLANDDKLCIYSAEQDYVSTFNDSVEALLDNTVYLQADDMEDTYINNIINVGELVIGEYSNHGFAPLDQTAFDQNGNIIETGEFISIDESIHNVADNDPFANTIHIGDSEVISTDSSIPNVTDNTTEFNETENYKPNYANIFNDIFNTNGIQNNINSLGSKEVKILINDLVNYFENNFGQIKYEELTSILSTDITEIIASGVEEESNIIGRWVFDEEAINSSINEILNSKEGKKLVLEILSCYLNNDIEACNSDINRLVDVMMYIFTENLDDGIQGWVNDKFIVSELKKVLKSKLELSKPPLTTTAPSTTTMTTQTTTPATTTSTVTSNTTASTVTANTTTSTVTANTAGTETTVSTTTESEPSQIALDPIVVEILGYPVEPSSNHPIISTTTVSPTTTVKK